MINQIKKELQRLEREKEIRILYAVKSGSRAWGFPSKDSDWDVRFFYIHHPDWYLSIDDKKDNMEEILPNDIDLAGWDLRKTLKLFRKSNPPLLEWLRSPIVYLEKYSTADKLRKLKKDFFSPRSCTHHYLHMAEGNFRTYLQTEEVRVKKYFYVLRPLLACRWIEQNNTMAPMEFQLLLETQVSRDDVRKEIDQLLKRKISGEELDVEPKIPILNEFIEEGLAYFNKRVKEYDKPVSLDNNELDHLFRSTLQEVWRD